jgi:hypothetical protein
MRRRREQVQALSRRVVGEAGHSESSGTSRSMPPGPSSSEA